MKDPFKLNVSSLMALYELFPTEESCIKHLEAINWQGKPVSPFDKTSKVYKLGKDNTVARTQEGISMSALLLCSHKQELACVNGLPLFGLSRIIRLDFLPTNSQAI